jgi:mannosyltransferase OCH1-like enzyme
MDPAAVGVSHAHSRSACSRLTYGAGWYIPPSWTDQADAPIDDAPQTPTEAATLALGLAMRKDRFLTNTKIPLIIHQTWKNLDSSTWSDVVRLSVNEWLEAAVGGQNPETPPAAYIMWDDKGVEEFMKVYENSSWSAIDMMPYKVEKADVFRVAVLKWFGGVVSLCRRRLRVRSIDTR